MSTQVDLRQLAVRRDPPAIEPHRRRTWLTRYLIPATILAGFAALLAWAARETFIPVKPVTVLPVLTTRAELQQGGMPLFVSSGWIEPRPTPVVVTALAEGVVEKLLVVEEQEVRAGDPVAHLIADDARLTLASAEANLRQAEAEAETLLARAETDLLFIPFQIKAAIAQEKQLRIDLENKKSAGTSVIPALTIARAESDWTSAAARLAELQLRQQRLERETATLRDMLAACRTGREWHADPSRPLTDVEATMKTAIARLQQAKVARDTARLRLDRMTVRAPRSGRVLALVARPGSRLMGQSPNSMHDASTVVTLYDPKSLQVRADVRFEDLPHFQRGQPVRIESPALPDGGIDGVTLFETAIADIQKNTLQVKVAIDNPPAVLKPDMLVQLTFRAPHRPASPDAGVPVLRLLVPRSLVETSSSGARVWVADQTLGVAQQRSVKLGWPAGTDLVEVSDGLTAADKLIVAGREALTDGDRIKITGEDTTLGMGSR
jgi:RND family efflux transporter MFP subunit